MIPDQVVLKVVKRTNFQESGVEWALDVQFVGHRPWTVVVWEKKPTPTEIEEAKKLTLRAFEVYHKHLHVPPFCLEDAWIPTSEYNPKK